MNALIDTLNLWGEHAVRFAWPMFWQSSVLIGLVFVLDYLLRKKIRAAIRYSLWLVVLAKLLAPPSIAFPTGAAWWLRPSTPSPQPPAIHSAPAASVAVSYGPLVVPPPIEPHPAIVVTQPAPIVARTAATAAWILGTWGIVSLGLFLVLLLRWRRVAVVASGAEPAVVRHSQLSLAELFEETKRLAGVRRFVRVRVMEQSMSPAVYGLVKPVILLPRSLVEQLSTDRLRTVLLHELIHLRRRDVWINCAQALLQIVYWWHPLLWLANARIRRLREEAVDDAVMIALREDADAYAPTLLEVAKLAFGRPPVSLGLVGILESRSALRQRIERLIHFKPPGRAGLSIVSVLALAVFAALAIPMGEAPRKTSKPANSSRDVSRVQTEPLEENGAKDVIELIADSIEYDPATRIQYAEGSVTMRVQGTTLHADSVTVNRVTGQITASGHVVIEVENGSSLSADQMRWNAGTDDVRMQQRDPETASSSLLEIAIDKNGTYWLGTNSLNLADLKSTLVVAKAVAGEKNIRLRVSADRQALFSSLVQLLDLSREQGITNVSVKTSESPAEPERAPVGTNFQAILNRLKSAESKADAALPRRSGPQTEATVTGPLPASRALAPVVTVAAPASNGNRNLLYTGEGRQRIIRKLDSLRLDFACDGEALPDVLRRLTAEVRRVDPDQRGVNVIFNPNPEVANYPGAIDPATGKPIPAPTAEPVDFNRVLVTVRPALTNARLADVLQSITTFADRPIKYSIRDYAVVFSLKANDPGPDLHTRVFKFNPIAFQRDVERVTGFHFETGATNLSGFTTNLTEALSAIENYFLAAGVDLRPSAGKNMFYKDRHGILLVNATQQDLDILESLLSTLNGSPSRSSNTDWSAAVSAFGQFVTEFQNIATNVDAWKSLPQPNPSVNEQLSYTGARPTSTPGGLQTRVFVVDAGSLCMGLEALGAYRLYPPSSTNHVTFGNYPVAPATLPTVENALNSLWDYLCSVGVDSSATIVRIRIWNRNHTELEVEAKPRDLDLIEKALATLGRGPQQISLKVQFAEVGPDDLRTAGVDSLLQPANQTNTAGPKVVGLLTAPQFEKVLGVMKEKGAKLTEGQVTTLSGYRAQVQVSDVPPMMTSQMASTSNDVVIATITNLTPATSAALTGPTLDVIPVLGADGNTIELTMIPTLVELIGYDDPGPFRITQDPNHPGPIVTPSPFPRFRLHQVKTGAVLWDGQTAVLGNLKINGASRHDKVPVLSDLPTVGRLFRSNQRKSDKTLLIFVTPTLIDPAGNRIHKTADGN